MFDSANRHLFSLRFCSQEAWLVCWFQSLIWLVGAWIQQVSVIQMAHYWPDIISLCSVPIGHALDASAPSVPHCVLLGLATLSMTEWYNTALSKKICVCGPIRVSEERSIASNSHILFGLLPCLSVSIFTSVCFHTALATFSDLLSSLLHFLFYTCFVPLPLSISLHISPSFCSIVHRFPDLFTPTLSPAVILSLLLSDFLFIKAVSMVG